jgi:uncharacterized membrane protein (UPF0127 family)
LPPSQSVEKGEHTARFGAVMDDDFNTPEALAVLQNLTREINSLRARGLMYRPPLEDDRGMLFQFPAATEQSFWMKNTPSSLDILYIDPQGRIVSIASHATPYSQTPLPSNGAANGVLELRAGRAEEIGAKPGDQVRHSFFRP